MIPYGRQHIDDDDIQAVKDVLQSDFLTQGPAVTKFEDIYKSYIKSNHAIAVSSATAALHIVAKAMGIGPGKRIWTSPITFVATSNIAFYLGADIDFIDIDLDSFNMSTEELEKKLVKAKLEGTLPDLVIPVHISGNSCNMQKIWELSQEYGFSVLEDASHGVGAEYDNDKVGSCSYSHAAVFSFHPVKIITSGEGGMITCNDADLAEKCYQLRTHGIHRTDEMKKSHGAWYYSMEDLGYNYRMTDVQAALGASQMNKLDQFITKRRELVEIYNKELSEILVTTPRESDDSYSSWHIYVVLVNEDKVKKEKKQIFDELLNAGIGVNLHYIPVYKQPFYQENGFEGYTLTNAEEYYRRAITLPLFPDLTENEIQYICKELKRILI